MFESGARVVFNGNGDVRAAVTSPSCVVSLLEIRTRVSSSMLDGDCQVQSPESQVECLGLISCDEWFPLWTFTKL